MLKKYAVIQFDEFGTKGVAVTLRLNGQVTGQKIIDDAIQELRLLRAEHALAEERLRVAREALDKISKLSTRLRGIDAHCRGYNECAEYYEKQIKKALTAYEQLKGDGDEITVSDKA